MKCLSLMQPWACLVLLGAKRHETRSWHTDYRGPLGIHASRRFPEEARQLCFEEPYRYLLQRGGWKHPADLPRGLLLGSVDLIDCRPAEEVRPHLSEEEILLGNFGSGRWAWLLANPRRLSRPIPLSGRLGLFDLPFSLPIS
jgi:hypothetical protein